MPCAFSSSLWSAARCGSLLLDALPRPSCQVEPLQSAVSSTVDRSRTFWRGRAVSWCRSRGNGDLRLPRFAHLAPSLLGFPAATRACWHLAPHARTRRDPSTSPPTPAHLRLRLPHLLAAQLASTMVLALTDAQRLSLAAVCDCVFQAHGTNVAAEIKSLLPATAPDYQREHSASSVPPPLYCSLVALELTLQLSTQSTPSSRPSSATSPARSTPSPTSSPAPSPRTASTRSASSYRSSRPDLAPLS